MLDTILKSFKNHQSLLFLEKALQRKRQASVHGLGGASGAFLAAVLLSHNSESTQNSVLAVFPSSEEAEICRDDIEAIIGPEKVKYFPERDTNPYEHADSHFEVRCQRVETRLYI